MTGNLLAKYIEKDHLSDVLINAMYEKKVIGGQRADGSQKDGFLKYEKNRPVGIYNMQKGDYELFDEKGWTSRVDELIGKYPDGWSPWKNLLRVPKKEDILKTYFQNLTASNTFGAELAKAYLRRSKEIGQQLLDDGIANAAEDVNGVLMNGFFHLYGPINDYI